MRTRTLKSASEHNLKSIPISARPDGYDRRRTTARVYLSHHFYYPWVYPDGIIQQETTELTNHRISIICVETFDICATAAHVISSFVRPQMLLNVIGSTKMENYKCSLSVVDVYDIAQDIGREFESIIDTFGTDAITGLMPKVVSALEQMEILAMKNERENTTVDDLRATIHQLEMDKQERSEDRMKYEKV